MAQKKRRKITPKRLHEYINEFLAAEEIDTDEFIEVLLNQLTVRIVEEAQRRR